MNGCKLSGGMCLHSDKHVYKLRLHIPGTKYGKITKILDVTDPEAAAIKALSMKGKFKAGAPLPKKESKPESIYSYILRFLSFCENPTKNRKPIDKSTVADYRLHLVNFAQALKEKGINTKIVSIQYLSDSMAETAFKYIDHLSGTTKKKYFKTYSNFYNHLIEEEKLKLESNPFLGWSFDEAESTNEVIYEKEFYELLDKIDTSPRYLTDGKGKDRLMHYDWVATGCKLGLFTGGRRQEIPEIKWTDVIENRKTGKLPGGILLLKDIKNTNIQKLSKIKVKPIEINDDLAELLNELGWKKNKGQDKHLIDPDEKHTRGFIKNQLSKSFAHFINFVTVHPKRELSFKCLRKTWFTNCAIALGNDNASFMGGHSSADVTVNHYINKMEAAGTNMKFNRIFRPLLPPSKKGKRKKEVVSA